MQYYFVGYAKKAVFSDEQIGLNDVTLRYTPK